MSYAHKNILVRNSLLTGNFNRNGIETFYRDVDRVMTVRNKEASAEKAASSPDVPATSN